MSMKINKLEIENVKRVKAVKLEPSASGLTIIGGNNGQGKTSVLDSIAWALGGETFRPSSPAREGSAIPPHLKITMSNGLVVERAGKNSALKVTDPSGQKAGQTLLDTFVEKLALNLPKFMEASGKEKANTLLKIIGVGDELAELDKAEKELFTERTFIGRTADQKEKYAKEQVYYPDAPDDIVSPSELIRQQQEILTRNGENQKKRTVAKEMQILAVRQEEKTQQIRRDIELLEEKLLRMKEDLESELSKLRDMQEDVSTAMKTAQELQDESTAELEKSIANVDEINRKVRANLDKDKAEEDAREYRKKYEAMTKQLEEVREKKRNLLESADLPLPGLSVKDGELVYHGQQWDNMSGAERLIVSASIVRRLNPECGFVLMDRLEQMDLGTLQEFGKWLEAENLQVIATRVSTGSECSIIIEDGYAALEPEPEKPVVDWRSF